MIGIELGATIQRNDGQDVTSEQLDALVDKFVDLVEKMEMSAACGAKTIDLDADEWE